MTPELKSRISEAILEIACPVCDGKGYRDGTPNDPTPDPCSHCEYTGFDSSNGSLLDVIENINLAINNYIEEYK